MKVLMLAWEYPPHVVGGLGKHVEELVPELAAKGIEVHLVVPRLSGGEASEALPLPDGSPATNGSKVYRVNAGNDNGNFFTNTWHDNVELEGFCAQLIRDEGGFDLIHNHDWLSAFGAVALKHDFRLPLVATVHATEKGRNWGQLYSDMQRSIHTTEWWLTYEAWRVITCSNFMSQEVQTYFGTPSDKIDVIPNGVDAHYFDGLHDLDLSSFRLAFARPDQPIVYYVGRVVPEKGLHVLIDAAPRVLRDWPEVKFVISGGGGFANYLRAKAYELGVDDNIIFTGRIPDETRDGLFKVADCAVFPSLYEPFGIVALEAMAVGTPVVVSDVGGLSEVVELHKTGIKVFPNSPESLAWGILHTLKHPEWSRQRAENARRVARSDYKWARIADRTAETYEHVLGEAKAGEWAYRL
jgi:glycosyltransferase involved in cell wall biosynthesis